MTLRFEHIYKAFDKELFGDLTIHFGAIGLIGVVGPSGCGKTTFINCVGGLEEVDSGVVEYGGLPIMSNAHQRQKHSQKNVSYLYQFYNLLPALTVRENIQFGMYCKQYEWIDNHALYKKLEIEDLLDRYPSQLSGGQKQRVALARAFLCNSPILLCDEPTGAMHQKMGQQVMKLLQDYGKKHLVLVVSHDKKLLEKYTNQIIDFDDLKHHYYFSERIYSLCNYPKKCTTSFLFTIRYCYRQFIYQKNTYLNLLLLQAITITCFLLLFGAKSGIEDYFQQSYNQYVTKNIVEVQKIDYSDSSFSKEELEDMVSDYQGISYDYLFDVGQYPDLDETIVHTIMPSATSHIEIVSGTLMSNMNEVVVNEAFLDIYQEESIVYLLNEQEYVFQIVGVIEDTLLGMPSVYYRDFYIPNEIVEQIENDQKVYLEVFEDQDIESVLEKWNDDIYYSFSSLETMKQGQSSLFLLGEVVAYLFMFLSFSISLLLIQLVYTALLYQRRKDNAIAFSNGMSKSRLCLIYAVEGFLFGFLVACVGNCLGMLTISLFSIYNPFTKWIAIEKLFLYPDISIYWGILFVYSVSCSMVAYIVSRKSVNVKCSDVIKEE